MRPLFVCTLILFCYLLVSTVFADGNTAPAAPSAQHPPANAPTPTHHQSPPPAAATPPPAAPATPATPAPAAPAAPATPAAPAVVAEHHHHKIEADVLNLKQLLTEQTDKLRQVSEDLGHAKTELGQVKTSASATASSAASSAALDALKSDVNTVKNSIESYSKNADQTGKLLAENAHSLRSFEEKSTKQFQELESKLQKLEKTAQQSKEQLQQIEVSFKHFQTEITEKLAEVKAAATASAFTFDWDTIWATIVAKSKEYAAKLADLAVALYERALKEFAKFRAESIPSREEAEKIVKEWWGNAQAFYWQTVQPNAIHLYQISRNYFDEATEQLTEVLAEKATVPKETARLIALSFLALTAGVVAFVVFIIVLQILSFILSIIFYFLCCRFCRSNKNKKNKKEKKVSAPPTPAAATSAPANKAAASSSSSSSSTAPPSVKKDNKAPVKSPAVTKSQ